jgi:hypothetical protein
LLVDLLIDQVDIQASQYEIKVDKFWGNQEAKKPGIRQNLN